MSESLILMIAEKIDSHANLDADDRALKAIRFAERIMGEGHAAIAVADRIVATMELWN